MQKWMVLILFFLGLVSPLKVYAAPLKLTLTEGVIQPTPMLHRSLLQKTAPRRIGVKKSPLWWFRI